MLIVGIVLGALMNKFCLINLFRYTICCVLEIKREPENWLSSQQKEGSNL